MMKPGILNRHGCPLHYWLSGPDDAPLLVFTPGIVMDHQIFATQVELFSNSYRVLSWDVRGHGLSRPLGDDFSVQLAAADLLAILDKIRADKAILIGHSMGGFISQELYFHHPQRVRALVVIGSICTTWKQPSAVRFFQTVSPWLFRLCPEPILRWLIRYSAGDKRDVRRQANLISHKVPRRDFLKMWDAVTHCDHREKGHRVCVPLMITHGVHDNLVGFGQIPKLSRRWSKREKAARCVIIPDAGHNAHQDNPDVFNQHLQNFLSETVESQSF